MSQQLKVAIIGSGNIGTDLMFKIMESDKLDLTGVIGIDHASEGLRIARDNKILTYSQGIKEFIEKNKKNMPDVVFDATSAKAHIANAEQLKPFSTKILDLTPAKLGPAVVPPVNLDRLTDEKDLNLITCGGQATIPVVHAVNRIQSVAYAEIVATISSKSAGPGTRENIDEFTQTTSWGIENIGGANTGKAIIILNPAEPPILMRDTVYCELDDAEANEMEITESIHNVVKEVQQYVPGYKLRAEPIFDGNTVTMFMEVEGAGHYLPSYSGNLDIMTAASVRVAEQMAELSPAADSPAN
ncbi:acetaldehyde dehydrogenase [Alteribacillus persepolensis]|uniref:Acetaldehyde dehydrogenase n=1 Tax=Alteribacillus persepolensis TaxID=568899 RepID=A0A1G8EE90_9BACI|nr:acetaldehyde dehydrogenase (acetylating) [Alteribacillus persepolensis]SDH68019.1 acetaldehyde dehydrogenase [Alteribacillus persepolensis]